MKCKENGSFGTILRTFSYFFPLLQWRYFLGKFGEIELVLILTNDLNEACPLAFISVMQWWIHPFLCVTLQLIDISFFPWNHLLFYWLVNQIATAFLQSWNMGSHKWCIGFLSWNCNLEELSMFATLGDEFSH